MEKKKKEIKKRTKIDTQSTIFLAIIALFVALIALGVNISKHLKPAYGATSYEITFLTSSGRNLSDTNYAGYSPPNGICRTDEYGYLDVDCAYLIACIDRFWSNAKTNKVYCTNEEYYSENSYCTTKVDDCDIDQNSNPTGRCWYYWWPTQSHDLNQNDLFTTRFTENKTYYGVVNQSYYEYQCDYSKPTESCYVCEGGSKPVRTINTTRAETMTGGTNCQAVEDSRCNPVSTQPSTQPPTQPSTQPSTQPQKKCYSCKLGEGKEYQIATSAQEAARLTGGTNCTAVSDTYCNNPQENCYGCDVAEGTAYLRTTSAENARNNTGGTNCKIVNDSNCHQDVPYNPPTGSVRTIIAVIIGLTSLAVSVVLFMKSK